MTTVEVGQLVSSTQDRRWVLPVGLTMVARSATTIQLGVDRARRVLVHDAPPGTFDLLRSLTGDSTVGDLVGPLVGRHALPPDRWLRILDELAEAGFLVDSAENGPLLPWPGTVRSQRHAEPPPVEDESPPAVPLRRGRQDMVTIVVGSGRIAGSVSALLAAAGVRHVHPEPHRPLRPTDLTPGGLAQSEVARGNRSTAAMRASDSTAPPRRRPRRTADEAAPGARQADREALAAMLRRVAPDVRVHPPAGAVRPDLVVLATDGPPDDITLRDLTTERVPHLAVRATELHGVVGPLVLPGRSSCLHCHDLHRRDADPGWPAVLLALRQGIPVPPPVLASSVAAIAVGQALQYLDGARRPDAIDGTLELDLDDWRVRRRSWRAHPECFCRLH